MSDETPDPMGPDPDSLGSPAIRTIAMPADANPAGDIFGGWLMAQMDLAAASVASRRAQGRVATAAVASMSFLHPVAVGDEVSIHATITKVGRTSIHVDVAAYRRQRHEAALRKVTEAMFVLVAIGDDGKPRPVPPEA